MPKISKGRKRPRDVSQLGKAIVDIATGEPEVNDECAIEGERQHIGRLGGKSRARNLSPEQRSQIARKAAMARWNKTK